MEMNCHDILEQKMCKEVEMIEAKYAQNPSAEMSMQDLERLNKLYHTLKSQATYVAMKEAKEYGNEGGVSERRGHVTANSYSDGYSCGYSEAMRQMNDSGHYSMYSPDQRIPRRW